MGDGREIRSNISTLMNTHTLCVGKKTCGRLSSKHHRGLTGQKANTSINKGILYESRWYFTTDTRQNDEPHAHHTCTSYTHSYLHAQATTARPVDEIEPRINAKRHSCLGASTPPLGAAECPRHKPIPRFQSSHSGFGWDGWIHISSYNSRRFNRDTSLRGNECSVQKNACSRRSMPRLGTHSTLQPSGHFFGCSSGRTANLTWREFNTICNPRKLMSKALTQTLSGGSTRSGSSSRAPLFSLVGLHRCAHSGHTARPSALRAEQWW